MKFNYILIVLCCFWGNILNAQTIYTEQKSTGEYGLVIDTLALTADRWTGWALTDTRRTICYDISFVDANSSCTSIDMTCETDVSNAAVVFGTGQRIPVFTSTLATGITTSVPATWRQTSTAGAAPGTSKWSWCVTNIPGPYIGCQFHANGVPAAADTIRVFSRGITP